MLSSESHSNEMLALVISLIDRTGFRGGILSMKTLSLNIDVLPSLSKAST